MVIPVLSELGSYKQVNEGIHRKAADKVGHPSITRLIGFWEEPRIPLDPNSKQPLKRLRTADERTSAINDYLDRLKKHLEGRAQCNPVTVSAPLTVDPHDRGQIIIFKFRWRGLFTTLRFEINTEFITCASIIDLSVQPVDTLKPPAEDEKRKLLIDKINNLITDLESGQTFECATYHEYIYRDIWRDFETEIIDYTPVAPHDDYLCDDRLGAIFADFRGLLLGDQYPIKSGGSAPLAGGAPIQRPFPDLPIGRGRDHNNDKPSEDWASTITKRIERFMLVGLEHAELTASRFLDGRILYVSALGPQSGNTPTPVFYLIHSCTDDEWQIGRLVDRLHTLGTLRLAASMQINELSIVGANLREIESLIERVRLLVRQYLSKNDERENLKKKKPTKKSDRASLKLQKNNIQNDLDALKSDITLTFSRLSENIDKMEKRFTGSIEDRIQQAKYYIEKFKADCEGLRQERLEGYQPYREFVLRRLGGTFSFISLMSERIQTYRNNLALLNDSYISLDLSITNKGIESLQKDVAQQDELMEDIQDIGEIVLFCIIAPHYMNETVFKLIAGPEPEPKNSFDAIIGIFNAYVERDNYERAFLLLIAVWIGCSLAAARILFGSHANEKRGVKFKLIGIFIIAGMAALGFWSHLPYPR